MLVYFLIPADLRTPKQNRGLHFLMICGFAGIAMILIGLLLMPLGMLVVLTGAGIYIYGMVPPLLFTFREEKEEDHD